MKLLKISALISVLFSTSCSKKDVLKVAVTPYTTEPAAPNISAELTNVTSNSFTVTWHITPEDCVSDPIYLVVEYPPYSYRNNFQVLNNTICENSNNFSIVTRWTPYTTINHSALVCLDKFFITCGYKYPIQGRTLAAEAVQIGERIALEATNSTIQIKWGVMDSSSVVKIDCTGPTNFYAVANESTSGQLTTSDQFNVSDCEATVDAVLTLSSLTYKMSYNIEVFATVEGFATKIVAKLPEVPVVAPPNIPSGLSNVTSNSFTATWLITPDHCESDWIYLVVVGCHSSEYDRCNSPYYHKLNQTACLSASNVTMTISWLPYHLFYVFLYSCVDVSFHLCGSGFYVHGTTLSEDLTQIPLLDVEVYTTGTNIQLMFNINGSNCTGKTDYYASATDPNGALVQSNYMKLPEYCRFDSTTIVLLFGHEYSPLACSTLYKIAIRAHVHGFTSKVISYLQIRTLAGDWLYPHIQLGESTNTSITIYWLGWIERERCHSATHYEGSLFSDSLPQRFIASAAVNPEYPSQVNMTFTDLRPHRYYGYGWDNLRLQLCSDDELCKQLPIPHAVTHLKTGPGVQLQLTHTILTTAFDDIYHPYDPTKLVLTWEFANTDCYGPTKFNVSWASNFGNVTTRTTPDDWMYNESCFGYSRMPVQMYYGINNLEPDTTYRFTVTPYTTVGTRAEPLRLTFKTGRNDCVNASGCNVGAMIFISCVAVAGLFVTTLAIWLCCVHAKVQERVEEQEVPVSRLCVNGGNLNNICTFWNPDQDATQVTPSTPLLTEPE